MRVIALVVLAAIIVFSGVWLARDRKEAPAQEPSAAEAQLEGESAPATVAPDAAGAPEESEGEEDEQAVAVLLPEGFELVDFLTEEPQQAFSAPEDVLEEDLDYIAVIGTSKGPITVDLFEEQTPVTVNNFVFLALHRYFEGVPFHRVIDGFMAQTGDPTGTGTGGPGYQFADEIVEGLEFTGEGILAMANAGPGTNGSQFFITFSATPWLNGAHTIFGEVTDGLELLPEITRADASQPNVVALFSSTVGELEAQGITLPLEDVEGDERAAMNVADAIGELLGVLPTQGQGFTLSGYRGMVGQMGEEQAFGFFLPPDTIQSVNIATRSK